MNWLMTKLEPWLDPAGRAIMRYSVVFFFFAFGLYKFTAHEADNIDAFLIHSPILSAIRAELGKQGASDLIGVVEVSIAVLIALRSLAPRLTAIGSLMAAAALLCTLSFLFTTPGLSDDSQGFLMKDLSLLGIAMWSAAEAWRAHVARVAR